jgi:hypothetical protein
MNETEIQTGLLKEINSNLSRLNRLIGSTPVRLDEAAQRLGTDVTGVRNLCQQNSIPIREPKHKCGRGNVATITQARLLLLEERMEAGAASSVRFRVGRRSPKGA